MERKYAMVVGDFPPDIALSEVSGIDYEAFAESFSKPLELRKVNYHDIPLFAIYFVKFDESNEEEFRFALDNDFREFILQKKE